MEPENKQRYTIGAQYTLPHEDVDNFLLMAAEAKRKKADLLKLLIHEWIEVWKAGLNPLDSDTLTTFQLLADRPVLREIVNKLADTSDKEVNKILRSLKATGS